MAIVVFVLCAGASPAHAMPAGSIRCAPSQPPKAAVLLLHPGGWVMGVPAMLEEECRAFARAGFDAVAVAYPWRDYFGALRAAESAARSARRARRPVYAVGWSAGGNMAEMLALRRRVTGAVAVAAPSNLLAWGDAGYWRDLVPLGPHARALASPLYRSRGARPRLLLMHSPADSVVPFGQSVALARRTGAELVPLAGDHLDDRSAFPRALRWVQREVARSAQPARHPAP